MKRKIFQKRRGFTLIELLAIIFIIGIIFGIGSFFVTNIIQHSKNKSQELTLANIKTTANIYVKENPNAITWINSKDEVYSCISIKKLINKGFLKETITENSDLTDDTYIIVTKNDSNNIISEELDRSKKCSSNLSCSIAFTGTKGNNDWYQTSGNVNLTIENPDNETISQTGLSDHSTAEFNNLTSAEQLNDTSGTTWYGYMQDDFGNIFSCQKEIKIDSTPPTCTSTGGKANWTKNNITLTGICSDDNSGCVKNVTKTFDEDINTTTASAGTVKDKAGNSSECTNDQTVKIDKTPPTKPTIVNPTDGVATSTPFSLTISSSDSGSGFAYYQYKFESSDDWNIYNDSSQETFVTPLFSKIRNELVYIQACDNVGNCSESNSTKINIETAETWGTENSCKYYTKNGNRLIGFQQIGTDYYYFDNNGCMVTGWVKNSQIDSNCSSAWWYFDPNNGKMVTGWKKINSKWYYMAKNDGKENKWQSAQPKGCMVTGWVYSEDYSCATHGWYFDSTGAMLYSTVVQGYTLDSSGCWREDVTILNNNYSVCPNDQNVPTPAQCATGQYNTLYVNNISVSGNTVYVTVRLHMNSTKVSWDGNNPTRTICLANTSNSCVINLKSFSIGSSNWTSINSDPINQTFSFNISGLSAGTYRIIVAGGSQQFRWQTTSYLKNTIQIK